MNPQSVLWNFGLQKLKNMLFPQHTLFWKMQMLLVAVYHKTYRKAKQAYLLVKAAFFTQLFF